MARLTDLGRLRRYRHVVLSPHFDDAALSLGATIARLATDDGPVLVVTTCAGVPLTREVRGKIARDLSSAAPSVVDYVLARRAEDLAAMDALGADVYWDSTLDAIYRRPDEYGETFEGLFGAPVRGDPLYPRALALVVLVLHTAPRATLWGPLGVGHHVDHHLVSDATLRGARLEPRRVRLYEDYPYVGRPGELGRRLAELPRELEPEVHDAARTLGAKLDAIAAYTSQVTPLFGGEREMREGVTKAAGERPYERAWKLELRS